ncbi:ABC transporter permease (plasmid) [Streptomyces sp. BHT-5-2]|uniref:ABC transporter permease n=1 Tax=Streptomyces sp. BHT-5-2 TaxID=2866715 RepID=UPI001C8DDAC6|nr:ABC transporter permease [Streptomyces sp. BHT-5-2]QZL08954.1 ABC transporter permease [Streptomyces sp. BHT-5-2]
MSNATTHLAALSRVELTLFLRSKSNLFNVLVIPAMITMGTTTVMKQFDLEGAGLAMGQVMISTSAGIVLVMALYAPLVGTYVLRREEHVLKRLRTGEVSDLVILASPAVPMTLAAVFQFALIATAVSVIAGLGTPAAPHLVLLGVLLGAVLTAAVAALSTAAARTAESAQGISTIGFLLLLLTSGTLVPLEVLPDAMGDVLRFFPLTPVTELVRSGWTGQHAGPADTLIAIVTLLAWTALAAWGAHRNFRWEPRT